MLGSPYIPAPHSKQPQGGGVAVYEVDEVEDRVQPREEEDGARADLVELDVLLQRHVPGERVGEHLGEVVCARAVLQGVEGLTRIVQLANQNANHLTNRTTTV